MPELVLVAALDRVGAIGRDNQLPWRLPADLRRFKQLTLGKTLLMGRRTAQSLGRALPQRRNLVLSRLGWHPPDGMEAVAGFEEAVALAGEAGELFVIGGGEIYELCLPRARRMHLTHVDTLVEHADAHFPAWDPREWRIVSREPFPADARHPHAYEFIDYRRRG